MSLRKFFRGEEMWRDDHNVDFSRKRRVCRNNSGISSEYQEFSPEDQTIEVSHEMEGNPSINKETFPISDHFEDYLNDRSYRLNRGRRVEEKAEVTRGSIPTDLLDGIDD